MADVGQEEDFEAARAKAMKCGASASTLPTSSESSLRSSSTVSDAYCVVSSIVMFAAAVQCNAIYENVYLLGTSLARPVIARGMIEVALERVASESSMSLKIEKPR